MNTIGASMARETKQDRIVRQMLDQVTEHLHELKALESNPSVKELDVERWAQNFLRNCLGYMSSSGYQIRAQEAKGKMRPDLVVLKNDKPSFVMEIKKLGFDLNKSDFRSGKVQLAEYLNAFGNVRWGILCNGYEWKLFDFSQAQKNGCIEIRSIDFRLGTDAIDISKKAVEELCYELLDFHENSMNTKIWEELTLEALAFSPESLTRAILSCDVVKVISRSIRGEHDYKANLETLTDKIYYLLELGLNDAIIGWNESKQAEIQKYVKSQKRAGRRVKRQSKGEEAVTEPSATEVATALKEETSVLADDSSEKESA